MGVATALAVGGLVTSAVSTVKSFSDAAAQRRRQGEAEQAAANAMAEARKKLEINFYDQMAIKKEPYELAREAMLSQGAQAIQAAQEQSRGAAATAGRIQMAQNEGQAGIRTAMGKEMTDIEKMKLAEDARLRDVGVQLDLGEAEGAQQAAADAQRAAAAAESQAWQGVTSTVQQGLSMIPLYTKTPSARQASSLEKTAMGTGSNQFGLNQTDMQKSIASMGKVNNVDLSKVGEMTPMQYKSFIGGLDVNTLKQINAQFPKYASSFNPNVQAQQTNQVDIDPFLLYR